MKKFAFLAIGLAVITASTTAFAGYKWSFPVTIYNDAEYSWAGGMIGSTRNTADGNSYIGCELVANDDYSYATCFASDTSGQYLSCYSRVNEGMKQAVASISDGAYLSFQTSTTDRTKCAMIQVQTGSMNEPPAP